MLCALGCVFIAPFTPHYLNFSPVSLGIVRERKRKNINRKEQFSRVQVCIRSSSHKERPFCFKKYENISNQNLWLFFHFFFLSFSPFFSYKYQSVFLSFFFYFSTSVFPMFLSFFLAHQTTKNIFFFFTIFSSSFGTTFFVHSSSSLLDR